MSASIEPFQYRVAQLGYRGFLGAHPGQMAGSGQLLKRHESLLASRDPRRLDLRASILDPFNGYKVKVFQQHTQISVYMIADLSLSMTYSGKCSKRHTVADFLLSAALSAVQTGDRFSFIGCGNKLDQQWMISATHRFGAAPALAKQLANAQLKGHAESMMALRPVLPTKRALIFLVSDFHFPITKLNALMSQFSGHAVVPVVLWDQAEHAQMPDWGILKLKDLETNNTKTLFMRPAYKQKITSAFAQRKHDLRQCFRSFAAEPLFMQGPYQAQTMTGYFQGRPV